MFAIESFAGYFTDCWRVWEANAHCTAYEVFPSNIMHAGVSAVALSVAAPVSPASISARDTTIFLFMTLRFYVLLLRYVESVVSRDAVLLRMTAV